MGLDKILKIDETINGQPVDFEIVRSPALFRDKHYQDISYRLVILHAMQHYFLLGKNPDSAIILLQELKNHVSNGDTSYYRSKFLELYSFTKGQKTGFVIIDRSGGCFPLILYPQDQNPDHGNRVWGFQQMLDDLIASHSRYDDLLKANRNWTVELVKELRSTFKFPEKNSKDDDFVDIDDAA